MADRKETEEADSPAGAEQPVPQAPESSWLDPGTWSTSFKFLPAYVVLVAIFIAVYWNHFTETPTDLSSYESCTGSFNYSFRINAAIEQAHEHSRRSWEVGYAFEATQQIFNPQRSVFGSDPFPEGRVPSLGVRMDEASLYAEPRLKSYGTNLFDDEKGAAADPAAVGVASLMLGQKWNGKDFMNAATRLKDVLLNEAPRWTNGAISHRLEQAELWSDAIAMFPPFLAYYGVATEDLDLIKEAVNQIKLYRDVLKINHGRTKGLWRHIVGSPEDSDEGAWSTGNAWAAYGMARVRATITAWPKSNETLTKEKNDLDTWIAEILSGAVVTDDDSSGLLRNYLGDTSWTGETSGTSLLAAAAYRMAIIRPEVFAKDMYLDWMHRKRRAVIQRVDGDGIAKPAINPLKPKSRTPYTHISPEGESFLLLLSTAWRDCVCSGICLDAYKKETRTKLTGEAPPAQDSPKKYESESSDATTRAFFYVQEQQKKIEGFFAPYFKPLMDYFAPP